jgi:hypothetical protein
MTQVFRMNLVILALVVVVTAVLGVPRRFWLVATAPGMPDFRLVSGHLYEGFAVCLFVLSLLALAELLMTGPALTVSRLKSEASFSLELNIMKRAGFTTPWVKYLFVKTLLVGLAGGWFWIVSYCVRALCSRETVTPCVLAASLTAILPMLLYRVAFFWLTLGVRYMSGYSPSSCDRQPDALSFRLAAVRLVHAVLFLGFSCLLAFSYGLWTYAILLIGGDALHWVQRSQLSHADRIASRRLS